MTAATVTNSAAPDPSPIPAAENAAIEISEPTARPIDNCHIARPKTPNNN